MRIALRQINPVIADFEYNTSLMREAIHEARKSGCSLAVFPELSLSSYPPRDLLEKPAFIAENLRKLELLASHTSEISVLCGYVDIDPKGVGKGIFNSAAFLKDGKLFQKGGKRLLPSYDVFDETRYFDSSPESLIFELGGLSFGVTICEDI
jgi:predicted amidohydrolase